MSDSDSTPMPKDLNDSLSAILQNPELMEKISAIVNSPSAQDGGGDTQAPHKPAASLTDALSDPALMAKLPEVISLLSSFPAHDTKKQEASHGGKPQANSKRLALLYALKPYLSPKRCEAIDYFARMSKMGDMIKNIKS